MQPKILYMNRIFHARVPWHAFLLLILLAALVVWSYWERIGLVAVAALLLMVFVVERMIHTSYTVTNDGKLVVDRGRFSARVVIPLSDIRSIERIRAVRIGNFCLRRYLLLHYHGDGEKEISLIPLKEEELVGYLTRQREIWQQTKGEEAAL